MPPSIKRGQVPSGPVDEDPIAVLIVDDHDMVAHALAESLGGRPEFDVVGVARTRDSVLTFLQTHPVQVMVSEIRLQDDDEGVLFSEALRARPDLKVLVLSSHSDDWSVSRAVEAGCHGYLLKDQHLADLYEGITAVHEGEAAFAPSILNRVLRLVRTDRSSGSTLTAREIEVLRLLADGMTTEQIAGELFVSSNTVRNHVNNIIRKLNVHSRLEAVSQAIRTGLIRVG
jgi:DNA-binding NarL/FixJ family response regulator